MPKGSSDLPESTTGRRIAFCSVLLRMEFTCARPVTRTAVVSYTAFPPLPWQAMAVYFCCTGLGVASTGRYPASCPVKPGLSSSEPFRLSSRDHLACLRKCYFNIIVVRCKALFLFLPVVEPVKVTVNGVNSTPVNNHLDKSLYASFSSSFSYAA